jgi:isochorismate hydrolase
MWKDRRTVVLRKFINYSTAPLASSCAGQEKLQIALLDFSHQNSELEALLGAQNEEQQEVCRFLLKGRWGNNEYCTSPLSTFLSP